MQIDSGTEQPVVTQHSKGCRCVNTDVLKGWALASGYLPIPSRFADYRREEDIRDVKRITWALL